MEVSGEFYAQATLLLATELTLHTKYKNGWDPKPIW
jgi:hypothetical protein